MSQDLVAAALWIPLDPARKLVLIALCDRADLRTGLCWPGREEVAKRASLSPRRTTPHLEALKELGYIRAVKQGNPRHPDHRERTTRRWLDVDKILGEGAAGLEAFREAARRVLGDDPSPDPLQPALLGDDLDATEGRSLNDQGTIGPLSGDVAAIETVITEPSDLNNHFEPPEDRASASTGGSREGTVVQDHVAPAREATPAHSGSHNGLGPTGIDRLTVFARDLLHQAGNLAIGVELGEEGELVVIRDSEKAIDALRAPGLAGKIAATARRDGYRGVKYSARPA